jgi:hypothetical protein
LIIVIAAALLLVGMLGWARGDDHHRGDDVGSLASFQTVTAP